MKYRVTEVKTYASDDAEAGEVVLDFVRSPGGWLLLLVPRSAVLDVPQDEETASESSENEKPAD